MIKDARTGQQNLGNLFGTVFAILPSWAGCIIATREYGLRKGGASIASSVCPISTVEFVAV